MESPAPIASAYLAAEGFQESLAEELARRGAAVTGWHGNLALSGVPPVAAAWSLNTWLAPAIIPVGSIGQAADALRAIQRNWGSYQTGHFRRAALIEARLPALRPRPLVFPQAAPASHLGAWTLLAPDTLLVSPTQTSPFVNGVVPFVEDRVGPPSRAYLKFWEACTRLGAWPLPGQRCLDLGASPGGWTWAIAQLGASVVAVDRAPLDPVVAAMAGVTERTESAFSIDPRAEAPVDWVFSDIIAYPARLLAMAQAWIASGRTRRLVCTVKFQGATDHESAEAFAAIPGGRLVHLFHNKNELTFLWEAT